MDKRNARRIALHDICAILGAANSQLRGLAPAYEANRFITEEDKRKIRDEWWKIEMGLVMRLKKAGG